MKDVKLVTISEYSKFHKIDRKTTYRLIATGKITRYRGLSNEPLLNLKQRPKGVKRYGVIRKRKIF